MKKLMILGASILQIPAIEKAKEMGLEVIVVDMNPDAIGFKVPGVVKEIISTIDTPRILEAAKRNHIDGIMTLATDMPMQSVARVAKELGLIGISEETALKATNKAYMRDALKCMGVPIPLYFNAKSKEEFYEAIEKIRACGVKCIIKPEDSSGSKGIILLENYNSNTMENAYYYAKKYSRTGGLMIEEYMEGQEVSVETLTIDGVCHVIQVTDKLTTGEPHFVEMGHSQPTMLRGDIAEKVRDVARAANRAIGITSGPSHTEIKITSSGPKVVEIGARLGGDNITTHLVPLSTGVDMVEACIQIALGEKPDYAVKFDKAAAIRYIKAENGLITDIRGVSHAKCLSGVQQVSIVYDVGDHVKEIESSIDRIGFVIVQEDSVEKAIEVCEVARDSINIVTEVECY